MQEGKKVLQVPGKAVLTRKAGVGKRRFRCVACGNYIPTGSPDSNNLYASGVEGLTVRTALCYAAYRGWVALSADIRTAFLHAPLTEELESEEVIIVKPPHILVEMNILSSKHRWRVLQALYGLRQAPLAWARFRDKSLRALTFQCDGTWYALQQGVCDDSLWFIVKCETAEGDEERWHGILIIYVDDLLIGFCQFADPQCSVRRDTKVVEAVRSGVDPRGLLDNFLWLGDSSSEWWWVPHLAV